MSVTVKSQREIELMREAGKILGTVLNELKRNVNRVLQLIILIRLVRK